MGEAHLLLAQSKGELGADDEALVHYHEALRLSPDREGEINPQLALCLSRLQEHDLAIQLAQEALLQQGPLPSLLELLASIYMAAEEWEEALTSLQEAEKQDPESAHLAFQLGWVHENLDQAETAEFGRTCLLARRLLEGGVRFIQIYSGGDFSSPRINWDAHENVVQNHTQEAIRIDQPVAALVRDLRQRGLLDDTLLLFTTEFGRTPFTQSGENEVGLGRDHNQTGFSIWLAGAGLRPGMAYGATDDIGWKSVEHPVSWHDFHATVLHLLVINHERLTYYHNGIQRRLTNVHGELVKPILA